MLSLVDWTYQYNVDLSKFGVKDGLIENGYITICQAYAKKIHSQIVPLMVGILKSEKEQEAVEEDGHGVLFTNAPYDMVKILEMSFEIVLTEGIKELSLRVVRIF